MKSFVFLVVKNLILWGIAGIVTSLLLLVFATLMCIVVIYGRIFPLKHNLYSMDSPLYFEVE